MGLEDLKGKSFLDIGCGSGLFSYAAFNLGAEKIISFDIDPFSVRCCQYLHAKANSPKNWRVDEGSILDNEFTTKLGKFDVVYAWGVLHHTGRMWAAIENATKLVNDGGYLYLAIYNRVNGLLGSKCWLIIKKLYNSSPRIGKGTIELLYILGYFITYLVNLRNPIASIKNYQSHRGMDWRTDIVDWLGGYPYEFSSVEEILQFVRTNFPELTCVNIRRTKGLGNNWFLFRKNKA